MEGVVRAEEGAELEACVVCLATQVRLQGSDGYEDCNLFPAILRELHSVIWCGLMDVAVFYSCSHIDLRVEAPGLTVAFRLSMSDEDYHLFGQ